MNTTVLDPTKPLDQSLVTYTHVIYALHALAVVIGLTSAATIVGTFVWSVPSIIAVVMNYARRGDVQGTVLASHFTWQIRTFWYTLLWAVVITLISTPLILLLGLGFLTFVVGFGVLGVWVLYRVLRGWLALRDSKPMYA
ncbi:MAG TPA: hypothetical protein P5528_10605 [Steroidobacteraceae bacterium]|nr:hypothetical protein [Steroidobacteraceae bacterium]HRX89884.1 hypothetical protein [Steroidobacteraceae bacterium]